MTKEPIEIGSMWSDQSVREQVESEIDVDGIEGRFVENDLTENDFTPHPSGPIFDCEFGQLAGHDLALARTESRVWKPGV